MHHLSVGEKHAVAAAARRPDLRSTPERNSKNGVCVQGFSSVQLTTGSRFQNENPWGNSAFEAIPSRTEVGFGQ